MKEVVKPLNITEVQQTKANDQASISGILQTYKDKSIASQEIAGKELLQDKSNAIQLKRSEEDELPYSTSNTIQLRIQEKGVLQKNENNTGLPDNLKSGVENLSGYSMDDVKVHYNSSQPATLQAHAFAQGTDIHIGPGQEKHLPHEAWHVVQQKQGRVKPTMQMKGKVNVNDDVGLEKEADVMGARALQMKSTAYHPNRSADPVISANGMQSIQRKVLINNVDFVPKFNEKCSDALKDAVNDEFLRYYESKEEAVNHIDNKAPGNFGLIKSRALWYRIPYLNTRFFVFGEYHSAVRGSQIKAASNITKPILDEGRSGWNVDEVMTNKLDSDKDTGLDENSSKLMRALEMWYSTLKPTPPSAQVGGVVPGLPKIPLGQTSVREETGGTHRLIVHGEGGKEEYWKESGEVSAPAVQYDHLAEMFDAIEDLFEKVFFKEISERNFNPLPDAAKVLTSWSYFKNKTWQGHKDEANIKLNVFNYLYKAVKHRVSEGYNKLLGTGHVAHLRTEEDRSKWSATDYRDEHMFVRVLEAQRQGTFAFANMGNAHLTRLKSRFDRVGMPYISVPDFFDTYARDAVDTREIAYKNSAAFRKNQRLALWVEAAFKVYPNLQQMHLDMLNNYDLGEFALKGSVAKWEHGDIAASQESHHQPVLSQLMRDIKNTYPNSDDFISKLTVEDLGEFLVTEKIAKWERG